MTNKKIPLNDRAIKMYNKHENGWATYRILAKAIWETEDSIHKRIDTRILSMQRYLKKDPITLSAHIKELKIFRSWINKEFGKGSMFK